MMLDSSTRRNLELCETLREKQKRGSLLWVLDKTRTAMGARTLRKFVEQPLIDKNEINRRLDAVEELKEQAISREEIREYLSSVYDLERLITKITYGSANPRDLTAFKSSLEMLPPIRYILEEMKVPLLQEIYEDLDALEDLCDLVTKAIREEPPIAMKEGNIIREGYNGEPSRMEKTGLRSWRKMNGKRPELKISRSSIIKYLDIIWKSQIPIKILYRIIIPASRRLPMRSVILLRN